MASIRGKYTIYIPGGNNTALVEGIGYTAEQRKLINDRIMQDNPDIEQVGFVALDGEPELKMAGGEFCGNATRSAAHFYMHGNFGELMVNINGKKVCAGVYKNGDAWCEIPLISDRANMLSQLDEGIYKVKMDGMVTIVILEEQSAQYLQNRDKLKEVTTQLIEKYGLKSAEAVGVMFLETVDGKLKINPVVWVNAIETLFNETACGSGTTATAIVKSSLTGEDGSFEVLQPSGYTITAQVKYQNGVVDCVRISGVVETTGIKKEFEVLE